MATFNFLLGDIMKNIQLYFIYVSAQFGEVKRKYTFVTPHLEKIKNSLSSEFSTILFPEACINISQEIQHTISHKKDKILYQLCQAKFLTLDYIKYENFVPFESNINELSFKTELLIENGQYEEQTPLEQFLKKYNILKSYYLQQIQFKVQVIRSEYSKEFKKRDFEHTYEINKIDMDIVDGKITDVHSSHIYTSNTIQKLLIIKGINDQGEKIFIDYQKILQNVEKKHSFYDEVNLDLL